MALGADNFKRSMLEAEQRHEAARMGAYKHMLAHAIEPVQAGLQLMLDAESKRRGRKHVALSWVHLVGTDVAAFMALKVVLNSIAIRTSVNKAARDISGLILDELRYRRFKEKAKQLFDYKIEGFTTSHYGHMKRSMDATMKYADIDTTDLRMSDTHRLLVGCKLLDVVADVTGLIELDKDTSVKLMMGKRRLRARIKKQLYLRPTEDTLAWLKKQNDRMSEFARVNYPMVVPPLPWAPGQRGGYRFHLRGSYPLARGAHHSDHLRDLEERNMPLVYGTLNRLQDTPWMINKDVLALVQLLAQGSVTVKGLAEYDTRPMPPKPADIDEDKEARRQWRKKASSVKEQNRLRAVRVVEQRNILRVAEQMAQYPAIYFPFNCDFRGRIYTVSSYLNPQGDDLSKALLTFAEGKPLGESGAVWLALHGANCLDVTPQGEKVSKMTLEERVSWITRHTAEIEEIAASPLTHTWWMAAEEPLQFYAFCCDWTRAVAQRRQTGSWSYTSSLPCGMDGSCNGLQHFNAMFLDLEGGRLVNLTDNQRPQDVYDAVAAQALIVLQALVGNDIALLWLKSGLISRKLCKRPTMTFGYGSKKWGFRDQLLAELEKREDYDSAIKPLFTSVGSDGKEKFLLVYACQLLGAIIEDSLGTTVRAASEGMAWLQACAELIAGTNRAVTWTVPVTGFVVTQEYCRQTKQQVKTMLAGSIVQPAVYTNTTDILLHKQMNAIAPNVVHSLDAAALMLTVTQAGAEGIKHFGMIHDSYSTVPADCERLAQVTRRAFVQLYTEQDVVADLWQQLSAQLEAAGSEDKIPPAPAKGTLDLTQVLRSKYFFA